MKKVFFFVILTFLLGGLVFAAGGVYSSNSDDENLVGSSCGTVTPGTNNECCINKGYSGWDEENFKCIGEGEENKSTIVGSSLVCIQDVKLCSDGSYVSRNSSKNCKFDACPEVNETECEAWKCTKWGACINGIAKRTCTKVFNCTSDEEKPKLTRNCSEKERIKPNLKSTECPENCICAGSTVKCLFENGTKTMTIYAGKSGNVVVQVKNVNMSTSMTLYKSENGTLYAVFQNNETKAIKTPDEIREKLQNRTKARLYNESLNLTEDGYYKVQTKKKARLFYIFPVREQTRAQIDAETGEIIKVRNPWWGFLAKDLREE